MEPWQNRNPANVDDLLPAVTPSEPSVAITKASLAASDWARTSLTERIEKLRQCQQAIAAESESLAHWITRETGKPITEARGELAAVVAKFDLTIADAGQFIADRLVNDGPHPALVRSKARGPAAVIAPFNFPIHLGHGATVAYLLAGSPVLFKPSPLAAVTGAAYGGIMAQHLPPGVFQIVQGGGEIGRALCVDPAVRNVCFTGSIAVGTSLATELAADYSKSLALELGGKCASIVCADADLSQAAADVTAAFCLTAGQRCNATSLVYVHEGRLSDFLENLTSEVAACVPGDPVEESTRLGPLISSGAVERYDRLLFTAGVDTILPGDAPETIDGKRGHWVTPAILLARDFATLAGSPLFREEAFCPILTVIPFTHDDDIAWMHNTSNFGLTTSIFTSDPDRFERIGSELQVGNLYRNLPTTFSPSTLPFGGLRASGNGKPGARGFIRFAADEQAVQWKKD